MTEITDLNKVQYSNDLILTTDQLAGLCGVSTDRIKQNFNRHEDRFVKGKHFYVLEGEVLKGFKRKASLNGLSINKYTSSLYLWTKRGVYYHSKMLNTDKAWDIYDELEESYFLDDKKSEVYPGQKVSSEDYVSALRLLADKLEEEDRVKKAIKLVSSLVK